MRLTRRTDYSAVASALILHRQGSMKYTGSTRHDLDSVYRGMTHATALITGCSRQGLVDLIELLLEENPPPSELGNGWIDWVADMTRRVNGWLS